MLAKGILASALKSALAEMDLPWKDKIVIEEPRQAGHGDLSTNAGMVLAKNAGMSPRDLAGRIAGRLPKLAPEIAEAVAAGPGFCNVTFSPAFWRGVVRDVERAGAAFGSSAAGGGEKVLVEYVSANPTGPLHVGHGRGAAFGDSLARILRLAGYDVATEYYLNDAGRQMRILGESIFLRARQLSGEEIEFPEDHYKGEYIRDLAGELMESTPDLLSRGDAREICQTYGVEEILKGIGKDLEAFRCGHDRYFSEKSLVEGGAVAAALKALAAGGHSYEEDGALWLETISRGDDRNRVLRKSDGSLTYFASDIAYHHDKFARGHEWLVDVWGADHHGYVPRMKAAIAEMGEDPEKFSVALIQLVTLLRDGETVPMSTRAGEFVTLKDVVDEVGADAARFTFLSRSADSPLEFDLELAKSRSMDNPVYYAQYAHARVAALLRRAAGSGFSLAPITEAAILENLESGEELAILRKLASFPEVVASSAKSLAPHHISRYLLDLAAMLHSYYARFQIINPDKPGLTEARLALSRAIGQTMANGLDLLGVSAPESM